MLGTSIFSFAHNPSTLWKANSIFWVRLIPLPDDKILDWSKLKQTADDILQVALQILGRKFYKNTKKSSLYSQSLLIFIHRTPVVEKYPITREIRDLLWPKSTPTGNTVYFYTSNLLWAIFPFLTMFSTALYL